MRIKMIYRFLFSLVFSLFLLSFAVFSYAKYSLTPGTTINLGTAKVEIISATQTNSMEKIIGSLARNLDKIKKGNKYVVIKFRISGIKKNTKLNSSKLRIHVLDGKSFGPPGFFKVSKTMGKSIGYSGAAYLLYNVNEDLLVFFEINDNYKINQMQLEYHEKSASRTDKVLIKQIQRLLKEKCYDPGPVDGVYGPATEKAINLFKKDNNLVIDSNALTGLLKKLKEKDNSQGAFKSKQSGFKINKLPKGCMPCKAINIPKDNCPRPMVPTVVKGFDKEGKSTGDFISICHACASPGTVCCK